MTPRPTVLFLLNVRHMQPAGGSDEGPDRRLLEHGLVAQGFTVRTRPLNRWPLNPLARLGTFFAGFDPVRALAVLLLDRQVDVIVSVGESNVALVLLLARLVRFKPRIVLREISARGWAKRDWLVDYVVPRVDRVMLLTPHQLAWAQANWRLRAPPDLAGFAIDEAFYRPLPAPDGDYILAVGDDAGRDYACLIAACAATPFRLLLRTDAALAIPEAMRARVTIIPRQSATALRLLYARAAIVAVPLLAVDHPSGITSLFEAMAMGCCTVVTDGGTGRAVVADGVNGVLVPPGQTAVLQAALVALMRDPARRRQLGAAARQTIEATQSYAAYVRRFAASLRSVAGAEWVPATERSPAIQRPSPASAP